MITVPMGSFLQNAKILSNSWESLLIVTLTRTKAPYRPYLAEYKYDYWNSSQIKTLCSYRNSSNDLSLTYAIILRDMCMGSCSRKLLVLQTRTLRLIYFAPSDAHAINLFIESKMLPVKMTYLTRLRISWMIFGKVQPLRL